MHLWASFRESNKDIRLLWASVFARMCGFGLTNQVLVLYLELIGVEESKIGLFMTLTLWGDTFISYLLTWYAEAIGRRRVMVMGTIMMMGSGLVFASCSNYVLLVLAAILGVISPSGDETGPFKSVEEASIAHLTSHNHRPEIFAIYGLFGTAGAAMGSITAGFVVDHLSKSLAWSLESCYRWVFIIYAGISVLKLVFMLALSEKCEISDDDEDEEEDEITDESSSLLPSETPATSQKGSLGLSLQTQHYLPRLLIIFMLDSFGYGLFPSAWVVYYFKKVFKVTASGLGLLFFCTNAIDAISSLPSAFFAKLLGPVKAILFTQAPSAVLFMMITFTSEFWVAALLYFANCATSTMDVVPRQILLTSIVQKNELTKVMGVVNIGKTFARSIGPLFTGKLAEHPGALKYGFVMNASCVLLADLILATNFLQKDSLIKKQQSKHQQIQ